MTLNRFLSGLLAIIYIVFAFTHFSFVGAVKFSLGLIVPLLCIWFSEAMGGFTGWMPHVAVTKSSPGWAIWLVGWLVLLVPGIIWIVYAVSTRT